MSKRLPVLVAVPALLLPAAVQARPLTTTPSYVLTVRVTITDTRIALNQHIAPRGVDARFVIKNTGARVHNFTLEAPAGPQRGFSRTLAPGTQKIVRIFLDRRARLPYLDGLAADRAKPAMRGFFDIR